MSNNQAVANLGVWCRLRGPALGLGSFWVGSWLSHLLLSGSAQVTHCL